MQHSQVQPMSQRVAEFAATTALFNTFADNMFRKIIREMKNRMDDENSSLPSENIALQPELINGLPAYQFSSGSFEKRKIAWVVYKHETMELVVWVGDTTRGPDHSYETKKAQGLADGVDRTMYGRRFVAPWDFWDLAVTWVMEYILTEKVPVITEDTFALVSPEIIGYVEDDINVAVAAGHTVEQGTPVDDPIFDEEHTQGDVRLQKEEELQRKLHDRAPE